MSFLFGCLAIMVVIVSLVIGAYHVDRNNYAIIHWLLGFCAALIFVLLLALGLWW